MSVKDSAVMPGNTYYYRVASIDANGNESDLSEELFVSTKIIAFLVDSDIAPHDYFEFNNTYCYQTTDPNEPCVLQFNNLSGQTISEVEISFNFRAEDDFNLIGSPFFTYHEINFNDKTLRFSGGPGIANNSLFYITFYGLNDIQPKNVCAKINFTVDPHVSSESGNWGDTISQPGWGFTPNGQAELHFYHPLSGVEEITYERIGSDGSFLHTYSIPGGKSVGIWQYWATDLSTGIDSPQVNYTICADSSNFSPFVTVSPSIGSKSEGTVLNEAGYCFTPDNTVTLHFIDPNGNPTNIPDIIPRSCMN